MMGHMGGHDWILDATNSGDWDSMAGVMKEMMWPYRTGAGWWFWQFHWILALLTWVLIIILLAALIRYFWKKGTKA